MTSDKKQKHSFRRILGYITPFLLTIVFLLVAFSNVDFATTVEIISNVSIKWLIVFVFLFFFSHYVRAVRWKFMLSSIKKDIKISHLFGAIMIGYGVNYAVPRIGEVYRAFFLGKWEGLSRTSMFGNVIIERIIDLFILLISVLISILVYDGNLLMQISWLSSALYVIGLALVFLILFIFLLVLKRESLGRVIIKIVGRFSKTASEKINYLFGMLTEGLSTIKGKKAILEITLLSAFIMFIYGVNSYCGFYLLGMDKIQNVTFGMGWVVMTIAAFGIVFPTPGGTGSYHMIAKLTLVALYGFSENIGFAYAFITHTIASVLFILSTIVIIFFFNYRLAKQGKDKVNFISVFSNNNIEK